MRYYKIFFSLFITVIIFQSVLNAQSKSVYVLADKQDSLQYKYFLKCLDVKYDKRDKDFKESLQSVQKLNERRDRLKSWYKNIIDELPEKNSLKITVTKEKQMPSYTVQWVSFESRPGFYVTGMYYIPVNVKPPFPAVYIPCGHSATGKAGETYQKAARLFAMNGFAVLSADPVSQGERMQYLGKDGKPITEERMLMHEILGEHLMLTGSNTLMIELWDNIRCIDFLQQKPEIDKNKIAVAGNSGGGTQTAYLTAFDERIKAAVVSCYISTTRDKLHTIGSQDGCQQLWGEAEEGIEEQDFLSLAAPTPILISSASNDFFRIQGADKAYSELKSVYELLGMPEKISHVTADGEHGWHKPLREAAVQWCKRWLMNDDSAVIEPDDIGLFTNEECLVTKTGQVLTEYENGKSVSDLTRERLEVCRENRKKFLAESTYDKLAAKVIKLTGYENPPAIPRYIHAGADNSDGYTFNKYLIERDSVTGYSLPAIMIQPLENSPGKAVIITGNYVNKENLADYPEIKDGLAKGNAVLVLDVCNTGELKDMGKQRYDNEEFFPAKLPLYEGKTLLAYRTEDIITAERFLQTELKFKNVSLSAGGLTIPAAIHAAFLDNHLSEIKIRDDYKTWEEIAASEYTANQLGNIVPCALNYYDIDDLLRQIQLRNSK